MSEAENAMPHWERAGGSLAPYAARAATSRGRTHPEREHPYRSPFQRARDRVIHSTAFRRLEYKTQVFVNHEGDHYRTRLTHTLEVAQIARTVARALGLNEDLTEAVALAHDLGHTPFGHSGEETLNELMRDHGGFEHNRHGLRVVDRLEKRYAEFDGLNLTYEVREAFVRHMTAYDAPVEAPDEFAPGEQVHLEGQVVCAADAIAYNSHDLDDGLASGLVREEDLRELGIWREAEGAVSPAARDDAQLRRRATVRHLIDLQVTDLVESSRRAIERSGAKSLDEVRRLGWLVAFGPEMAHDRDALQEFLYARLYRHERVAAESTKGIECVRALFECFMRETDALPKGYRARIGQSGESKERVVCDYVAGLTHRFALAARPRLFGKQEA